MFEFIPNFHSIYWREPWLLCIAGLPFALRLMQTCHRVNQHDAYADSSLQAWVVLSQSTSSRLWQKKSLASILAWLLFSISAAGPRLLVPINQNMQEADGNILLLVDISRSMLATDEDGTRIRRVQIEIEEFLQYTAHHRVGLMVFAARAHLYVPFTSDYSALNYYLSHLNELVLPTAGSRPIQAIEKANKRLEKASSTGVILLFSDGDWDTPDMTTNMAYPIFVLGVGREAGKGIRLKNGQWLKYAEKEVVSRLNEPALQQLAELSGGAYHHAQLNQQDWRQLYDQGIRNYLPAKKIELNEGFIQWHELYIWILLPALFLWLFSISPRFRGFKSTISIMIWLILLPLSLFQSQPILANDLQQAEQFYLTNNYSAAIQAYQQLKGYQARLGEGASHYRLLETSAAINHFSQAVLLAENNQQRASALFNLGNSYFQQGDYANASLMFSDALRYQPDHQASQFNLSFSQVLAIAVQEKIAQQALRSGTGSKTAQAMEGLLPTDNSIISLAEMTESSSLSLNLPHLPTERLAMLLNKGLEKIRLADDTSANKHKHVEQQHTLALADARMRIKTLEDQQAKLWIRLFEMEEGFPASVEEPQLIRGVQPW